MGACCASGGRDGTFDQKEDKLAGPALKKDEELVEEKTIKPLVQESPEEIEFRTKVEGVKSHLDLINV